MGYIIIQYMDSILIPSELTGDSLPKIDVTDAELDLLVDLIDGEIDKVDDCLGSLTDLERHESLEELLTSTDPVTSLKADMKHLQDKILIHRRKVKT